MKVIVSYGYGNFECCVATVENAKKLLNYASVPEQVRKFNPNHKYRTKEKTVQLLEKIMMSEIGTQLSDKLTVTAEMQAEITQHLRKNSIRFVFEAEQVKIDPYQFWEKQVNIPTLSDVFSVPQFDGFIVDWGSRWYRIQNDKWKATATEDAKIRAILLLANELMDDSKYALIEVRNSPD